MKQKWEISPCLGDLFDGVTFVKPRDGTRLQKQLESVRRLMQDGVWRTLGRIAADVGAPESSVSARLRNLRKPKFGGYLIERKYVANGLWQYRLQRAFTP